MRASSLRGVGISRRLLRVFIDSIVASGDASEEVADVGIDADGEIGPSRLGPEFDQRRADQRHRGMWRLVRAEGRREDHLVIRTCAIRS